MLQRYTFLEHPFNYILKNSRQMISGLDKCMAVFYNQNKNEVEALVFDGELNKLMYDDTGLIGKLRSLNKKANWIKPNQVPFETKTLQNEQLTFTDEEESSVLELRFQNTVDNKADVIYFYFKNNIANFKLSSTNEAMAITIKEVIQNLIYNQLTLLLEASNSNRLIHQKIASNIDFGSLQTEISNLKERNFKQTNDIYSYLLNELTTHESTDFVLSEAAIKKLVELNINLVDAKEILRQSLEVLVNKYVLGDMYEISENDIITSNRPSHHKTVAEENLDKTVQFLNRYEHAAKLLISKNEKITGINIGNTCQPNVSAAAISDILKKHQSKIIKLFNQQPEKWSSLRQNFRPIKSIVEKSQTQSFKGFSA